MSKQKIDENKLSEYNNHWIFESFRSKFIKSRFKKLV